MKLTSEAVQTIFFDCLYKEGEDTTGHIAVQGVANRFGLHPERLASHKDEIRALLKQLPTEFQIDGGGGYSFLNACLDVNEQQWGEQRNAEQIMILGLGCDLVTCPMPKETWSALPGGVPYYCVNA